MSLVTWWAQSWFQNWPLERGRYIPMRLLSAMPPQWFPIGKLWILLHPRDGLQRQILVDGEYEPDVGKLLRQNLKPGGVFVDVGANIGYFTLLAREIVGNEGSVHALEPNPRTAVFLRQNINRNGFATNVHLHELALSEQPGEIEFYLSPDSGSSSFSSAAAGSEERVTVRCELGDTLFQDLPRLDFLKMDVEGAELKALRGLRGTLERFRPLVVLEIFPELLAHQGASAEAVRKFMAELGYQETPLDDKTSFFTTAASRSKGRSSDADGVDGGEDS